jgi:hypothetical protein
VVLAFYVHGFDTSATDARIAHAYYGSRLSATGLGQSLVVAASWPSNCDLPSSARQYAEQSANLMAAMIEAITLVRKQLDAKYGKSAPQLVTAVITHSMGNYLMSKTLASGKVPNYVGAVDWVLMLAPDVDHAIFTKGSSVENQGKAIYQMANGKVWVFWTWNDEVLEADEYAGDWYVLGYRGPQQPISPATPNVVFIDRPGGEFRQCRGLCAVRLWPAGSSPQLVSVHHSTRVLADPGPALRQARRTVGAHHRRGPVQRRGPPDCART